MTHIDIDGGAGGGQILRSALTLAALTDTAVTVYDIRGNRDTPGLRPQHAACVQLLAAVTDADVEGAEVGSERVTFRPNQRPQGHIECDIGTAGSISLLFDTVIPLASRLETVIEVTAMGGTNVKWSPPIEYLQHVKLPVLATYGLEANVSVQQHGFYPEGGGRATLTVSPSSLIPITIPERGSLEALSIHSVATSNLENAAVADRQADAARSVLEAVDYSVASEHVAYTTTRGTGSSILVVATFENSVVGFDSLGAPGKPAETVGTEAANALVSFFDGTGATDTHLGDQLMLPLAIAGGSISTSKLTEHIRTNAQVIQQFGLDISWSERERGDVLLEANAVDTITK